MRSPVADKPPAASSKLGAPALGLSCARSLFLSSLFFSLYFFFLKKNNNNNKKTMESKPENRHVREAVSLSVVLEN